MGQWTHKFKWRCFKLLVFSVEGKDRNTGFIRNTHRRGPEKCEKMAVAWPGQSLDQVLSQGWGLATGNSVRLKML